MVHSLFFMSEASQSLVGIQFIYSEITGFCEYKLQSTSNKVKITLCYFFSFIFLSLLYFVILGCGFSGQTVGVIVRLETEEFQVLNMHGKTVKLKHSAVSKRRENRNAVALDAEHNSIAVWLFLVHLYVVIFEGFENLCTIFQT